MSRRPVQATMTVVPKKTKKIHPVIIPNRAKMTQRVILIATLIVATMFTMRLTGTTQNLMMSKMKVLLQQQV